MSTLQPGTRWQKSVSGLRGLHPIHSADSTDEPLAVRRTSALGASPEHALRVRQVVEFALQSLTQMYREEVLRFCYAMGPDPQVETRPSFRYTAIALLGLHAARVQGLPVPFPVDAICADLARQAAAQADLGDKGLALWTALKFESSAANLALRALLAHDGLVTHMHEGLIRSTELAWAVYALGLAWADLQRPGGGLLPRQEQERVRVRLHESLEVLRSQRNGRTGLFQCAGIPKGNGRWRDRMMTTSGFFDSQVYGTMALAQAGKTLDKPNFLQEAHATIQTILSHQGPYGEWPWHYDVRVGTIIDPYPIYAVHQDGMGPMMLLEVGEAFGADFYDAVERSLSWVFGANELQMPMVDPETGLIWRAQGRKGLQQYVLQACRVAHHYRLPLVARMMRAAPGRAIHYECRPYHLGWILYAFCRPSELVLEAAPDS